MKVERDELDIETVMADLEINPLELDEACISLPNDLAIYGMALSEAEASVKWLEQDSKEIRSQMALDVTADPEQYLDEGVKPTGPIIEAYYRASKQHKEVKRKLVHAQRKADRLRNVVFALQAKSRMIDNLVHLVRTEYLAGPTAPRDLSNGAIQEKRRKRITARAKHHLSSRGRPDEDAGEEAPPKKRTTRKRVKRRRSE